MSQRGHVPVLLQEVMEFMDAGREGIYLDCTIGLGGHSLEILKRNPQARLIGFDIDESALREAEKLLRPYRNRVELYHADFRLLPELEIDFSATRGLLLDLGLSSFQLDSPERGFSFNQDGPLDMRMDTRNKTTASKIINTYSEPRLAHLFRVHGELKQASRLAREIVTRRKIKKIERTAEFRQIIEEVCRWIPQKGKIHPAAKVFQALRIEVNQELEGVDVFLETMAEEVPTRTRFVAISFQSQEDRMIKRTFARLSSSEEKPPRLKILTKKPVTPGKEEVARNPRSHSAKLRAAERI